MKKPELSIIILNYNTQDLLRNCLNSIYKVRNEVNLEVLIIDNGSSDGSIEMLKNDFSWAKLIQSKVNLGFARGNNLAKKTAVGKYILFLNSDTLVHKNTLKESLNFIKTNSDIGAMTCKLVLADGNLDKDARRRFPTPWISFNRLILGNSHDYWYEDVPDTKTHEVEVIQGAFFLSPKEVLDKVHWFSEDYFLDGEDIDLCWKIKEQGYKIIYYPKVSITHLKKGTKRNIKNISVGTGVDSMEIFYKKYFWKRYPLFLNYLVLFGIFLVKLVRKIKNLI